MVISRRRLAFFTIGKALFLMATTVEASGLFYSEVGTTALGRGGAFVARADDLSAFYHNPAGLSKSTGINALLGGNINDLNVTFQRKGAATVGEGFSGEWFPLDGRYILDDSIDPPVFLSVGNPQLDYSHGVENPRPFEPVSQQSPVIVNAVTAVVNWGDAFGLEGLALALGLFAPSGYTKHKYPTEGPQRYALRELNSLIIYPGLGASYRFNRYLQVGAVLLNGMAFIEKSQASRLSPTSLDTHFNEDVGGDASIRIDTEDLFMPTAIAGLLSQPLDWLELGIAVRFPVVMKASGNVKYMAPETDYPYAVAVEGHHSAVVEHHFPWVVTSGVRYIHRRFDIEVDFVWENWSSYDGMDVDLDLLVDLEPEDPAGPKEIPDTHIPKNFRDTYSVRLGSDIEILPGILTFRVGGLWQSSAYPTSNNTFSLDFPYGEQFGASTGLSVNLFDFLDVTVGYMHLFQERIEVTEGILQQSSGTLADVYSDGSLTLPMGNTVNNGTYDVSLNIYSLAVEGHF